MSKRHYDEASVIKSLNKKGGVSINTVDKVVSVQINNSTIGNGSWGKIDYLCHYCGYFLNRVLNLPKKKSNKAIEDFDNDIDIRHNHKINMAAMSKASMKKVKK